mgnify:CR=1 FL=1
MTEPTQPTRSEIMRPLELLLLAGGLALFVGLTVLLSTRQPLLAMIFFGVAFIVSVVVIAMLAMAFKPNAAELQEVDGDEHPDVKDNSGR